MNEREKGGVPDDALIRTTLAGDDGAFAEQKSELVEGIELERISGFDLRAAATELLDGQRLRDRCRSLQLAQDRHALVIALVAAHKPEYSTRGQRPRPSGRRRLSPLLGVRDARWFA